VTLDPLKDEIPMMPPPPVPPAVPTPLNVSDLFGICNPLMMQHSNPFLGASPDRNIHSEARHKGMVEAHIA